MTATKLQEFLAKPTTEQIKQGTYERSESQTADVYASTSYWDYDLRFEIFQTVVAGRFTTQGTADYFASIENIIDEFIGKPASEIEKLQVSDLKPELFETSDNEEQQMKLIVAKMNLAQRQACEAHNLIWYLPLENKARDYRIRDIQMNDVSGQTEIHRYGFPNSDIKTMRSPKVLPQTKEVEK